MSCDISEILLLIILVVIFGLNIYYNSKSKNDKNIDQFAGALTQLYSKGPEDRYLTVDTDKYVPEYQYWYNYGFGYPWGWMPWNMATRYNYYPLYGVYPNYYAYPYVYWQILR